MSPSQVYFVLALGLQLIPYVFGDDENSDSSSDITSCMPQLADSCFNDVYANLECQLNSSLSHQCERRDIEDLCNGLSDSLTCCSDIIDTDCTNEGGRTTFDSWLKGLTSVYTYLCENNNNYFKALLSTKKCWNILSFVTCVEKITGVGHVVDMLQVILDKNECNRLLIAMSTCNVRATATSEICELPLEVISETIHMFFSQTECGSICSNTNKIEASSIITVMIFVKLIENIFH